MFKWISKHRTWTLFLILSMMGVLYLGYSSVWEPVVMMERAKETAGETVNFTKTFIDFLSQENTLNLIKVLTPFLVPIITWKIKERMDNDVRSTTNKVVRGKLKVGDRRQDKVKVTQDRRTKKTKK